LEKKLDTTLQGTVSIQFGGCAGIVRATTDVTLTGSPALGNATLVLDICVTSTTPNDRFHGTFVLASRLGTITGPAVIWSPDPPGATPQEVFGELTPAGGSGPLAHVEGLLALHLLTFGSYPAPTTGTLSPPSPT
jgi:hypothetical protein